MSKVGASRETASRQRWIAVAPSVATAKYQALLVVLNLDAAGRARTAPKGMAGTSTKGNGLGETVID
jgi:hypothetical protein